MIRDLGSSRRVVRSWPGQGTGETIYQDDRGTTYREVSEAEARIIESGTAGRVYRLEGDTIR